MIAAMSRIYNFSAGPSMLPEEVLRKAATELVEYGNSGQSVMEMSHRSPEYEDIINGCESLLREVMGIPDNYKVLFLQGGASLQFSMVPLNLMTNSKKADLIQTGIWSKKAKKEIEKIGQVNVIASSEDVNFSKIPDFSNTKFTEDANLFYICQNNTIYGTKYKNIPETGNVPLVSDVSSCILSEPMDVSKYGLLFAGAQKNMGPAGLTTVIIREDLVGKAPKSIPTMLDYKTHVDESSMFNTPPTYSIYMCKLVLEWIKNEIGGLNKMGERNREKAKGFYDYLDSSNMFKATVFGESRSIMNIPFVTGNKELDSKFIKEAQSAGFINLKGHRLVGGMRASIYNAMPIEGVKNLIEFMKNFECKNK